MEREPSNTPPLAKATDRAKPISEPDSGAYCFAAAHCDRSAVEIMMSKGFKITLVPLAIALWLALSFKFMWFPVAWRIGDARDPCVNNLRQIDGAKEQWAMAVGCKTNGQPVIISEVNEYMNEIPVCPEGGTYDYGVLGERPSCSLARTNRTKVRVSLFRYKRKPMWRHSEY